MGAVMKNQNGQRATLATVVGYASVSALGGAGSPELKEQAEQIAAECERRELALLEVVTEREQVGVRAFDRPGLAYAFDRISAGDATGLIVADLSRLTHSAVELGTIIRRLTRLQARLVAAVHALDTEREDGRLAAELLVEISGWERKRLSERTRKGLEAARNGGRSTGRAAVADYPDLIDSITRMRADGMTLQEIADRLNADGVPTIRGGAKWRHSSVQVAAGYRRRGRAVADV
jgi:DNA invertase Pin-like site-specific DNA recombinase